MEERNIITGEHVMQPCSVDKCNSLSECTSYTNQPDNQCRCLGGFQSCEVNGKALGSFVEAI